MELLIPGLILVALMVWASTRIKKNAAAAYLEETVETDRFSIRKPEGFLSPVDPPAGTIFTAYSREFGEEPAESIRRALVEVTEQPEMSLPDARLLIAENSDIVSEGEAELFGDTKAVRIQATRLEDGTEIKESYKLIDTGDSILQLRFSVISEHEDEYSRKIDEVLDSFRAV